MTKKTVAAPWVRTLKAITRRLFKAEQKIILLQGDRNKLQRQVKELQAEVCDLDSTLSEILH
jgi:hypothetical protein